MRGAVLGGGETWLNRAFVVNDWYISGYLPLTDSFGERVGMLYVGFFEEPFSAAKRTAFFSMLAAFVVMLAVTVPFFLRMAKGIFEPLERMTQIATRVEQGDMGAQHLDTLHDAVQDRDRRLRDRAEHLNQRVEERTGLGLSISQALIQQTGGIITAASAPGGGAEFRVWLAAAE